MEEPLSELFTARHFLTILGVLTGYDQSVIAGTHPPLTHALAVTAYFYAHHIRIFDCAKWAEPFRDEIRANAERFVRTTD